MTFLGEMKWGLIMSWKTKRPLFAVRFAIAAFKDWKRMSHETVREHGYE